MQTFVSSLTRVFNEREAAMEAEAQCGVPARCDFVIHDRNLDDVFALSRLFPSLIAGGIVTRERVLQALSCTRSSDRRHDSSP